MQIAGEPVRVGMLVRDIRGRTVGHIRTVFSCCFEVQGESFHANLNAESVYNVDTGVVSLICDMTESDRYACLIHRVRAGRTPQSA